MGEYSKRLNEKTEEELNEILNSISTYAGEFIDDYLAELDRRRILWDMKILLKEKDLITLTIKLESISNSKYLNLLKRELEIRGLDEAYKQQINGNTTTASKTESQKSNSGLYAGLIGLVAISSFLLKKFNENEPKQNFNNEITVPSVNPTYGLTPNTPTYNNIGSGNHLTPADIDFDLPELETKKNPDIKLPKIDFEMSDLSKMKPIWNNNSTQNNLNPGFQKILDTISK